MWRGGGSSGINLVLNFSICTVLRFPRMDLTVRYTLRHIRSWWKSAYLNKSSNIMTVNFGVVLVLSYSPYFHDHFQINLWSCLWRVRLPEAKNVSFSFQIFLLFLTWLFTNCALVYYLKATSSFYHVTRIHQCGSFFLPVGTSQWISVEFKKFA